MVAVNKCRSMHIRRIVNQLLSSLCAMFYQAQESRRFSIRTVFLSLISCSMVANGGFNSSDAVVLMKLKSALDPKSLSEDIQKSWKSRLNCSSWDGVTCDDRGERVTEISLDSKKLGGTIPPIISKLTSLKILDLGNNFLTGTIPGTIGELTNLQELELSVNSLNGSIPESIGNLSRLQILKLSTNKLTGTIPSNLGHLNVSVLDLSYNGLTGTIPDTIYTMKNLTEIYLEFNQLSGNVSDSLSNLTSLLTLSLFSNQLSGNIPDSISNMKKLLVLDLSGNYFSGAIFSPNASQFLRFKVDSNCLNSSENSSPQRNSTDCSRFCNANLAGGPCSGHGICYIPDSSSPPVCNCTSGFYLSLNSSDCLTEMEHAAPPPRPPSGRVSLGAILGSVAGALVVAALLAAALWWWCSRKAPAVMVDRATTFDRRIRGRFVKYLTWQDIVDGTNNFSEDNKIGSGGFGSVYRAVGPDGEQWAVKRATNTAAGSAAEFQREINFVSTMFHKSILSLKGYCDENGERVLVYDYMANGSLWHRLHRNKSAPTLTFEERINIAVGTAEGLHYLHDQARPTIIHRDVKSDNILLDENLNAHVADFGLLKGSQTGTDTFRVVGTPGYIDPEYIRTYKATPKSDVYSFGIVLLELITGLPASWTEKKGAGDRKGDVYLIKHVNERVEWDVAKMVDPELDMDFSVDAMNNFVALAEKCVSRLGRNRPSMQEACAALVNIKVSMKDTRPQRPAARHTEPSSSTAVLDQPSSDATSGPGSVMLPPPTSLAWQDGR